MVDYHIFFPNSWLWWLNEFDTYKPTRISEFCTSSRIVAEGAWAFRMLLKAVSIRPRPLGFSEIRGFGWLGIWGAEFSRVSMRSGLRIANIQWLITGWPIEALHISIGWLNPRFSDPTKMTHSWFIRLSIGVWKMRHRQFQGTIILQNRDLWGWTSSAKAWPSTNAEIVVFAMNSLMAGSKCQLYVNPSRNLKPFLSFILKSAYSCTNIHIKNIQLPVISPFSILFPLKSHHFFVHLFFFRVPGCALRWAAASFPYTVMWRASATRRRAWCVSSKMSRRTGNRPVCEAKRCAVYWNRLVNIEKTMVNSG